MHPPDLPCPWASLQMLGMAMSHKTLTGQFISLHQQSYSHAHLDAVPYKPLPRQHVKKPVRHLHFHTSSCGLDNHRLQGNSLHVHPDVSTCASLLRQYANPKDLPSVRHLHHHIISHALEKHKSLEKFLLYAYSKSGTVMDALAVFARFIEPDPSSWNFVIALCAKHGESTDAFQLFEQMLLQNCLPDQFLLASILSACCLETDLQNGKSLHARVTATMFEFDLVVGTALVHMYGKCCSLEHAHMAFVLLKEHDVVSWNAIIAAFVHHGESKGVIHLYETMHNAGVIPNEITFASFLSACADGVALTKGTQIHAQLVGAGVKMNIFVVTSLLNMYGKCGRTLDARRLFDGTCKEDVVIWNAIISAYSQNGQGNDALEVFEQMKREGVKPTRSTFIAVLEACMNEKALSEGKQIHLLIKQYGYELDAMVGTSLLNMYGKCGSLEEALTVFDKLVNRSVVSWNALIASYAQGGFGLEALQLSEQMLCEGVIPDEVTYVNIVPMCASHGTAFECKRVHSSIVNIQLESDENLRAGIVNMYGKKGRLKDAWKIFNLRPSSSNVSLWTALFVAYDQSRHYADAIECFNQMLTEGVLADKVATVSILTIIGNQGFLAGGTRVHTRIAGSKLELEIDVQNALFTMYGKCGNLEAAQGVFGRMIARDAISFRAMIALLIQLDKGNEAIQMFWQMLYEGVAPDNVVFASVMNVCGTYGTLSQGSKLHACCFHMNNSFKPDNRAGTALLSMYACCGCLSSAKRVLQLVSFKEVFTWTALMEACAYHGDGKTTLFLFYRMQESSLSPDRATTIKLLSACSHAGLVSEACYAFGILQKEFCIELIVDHYNCMVDLFGRIGQVEEAEEVVKRMPILPNAMTWSTLLGACRMFNDVKGGELAALCIIELDGENVATYILLSNIYAAAGACEDAVHMSTDS